MAASYLTKTIVALTLSCALAECRPEHRFLSLIYYEYMLGLIE